ncbi:MAG: ionic transporter y4hA [Pseudomonadota bacterium]
MSATDAARMPLWSMAAPLLASGFLLADGFGLFGTDTTPLLVAAAVLLGAAVFAAVHHAEVLALRMGEPFGSILLAVAVTVIEVALIVSILLSDAANSDTVARDTVFSTIMIVLNGVIGLCLVMGGRRHHEQRFQIRGAAAALSVLGTLAVFALVMPNFTTATEGPYYVPLQLLVVGVASLGLYVVFVFVQTIRHRDYFQETSRDTSDMTQRPPRQVAAISAVLLVLALVAVVLLAKMLSPPLERAVRALSLPRAVVGVVIAAVVLLPESVAALRAALANRLQASINLALGSAVASIGLTIPTVALVSMLIDRPLLLGITPQNMVLLVLTLFVSALTFGTGRTTILHGAVHLAIFAIFLLIVIVP